jgi:hypothetical protein
MRFLTVAVFMSPNELLQNFAFGVEPIVQRGILVGASGEPKLVCALLDLSLNLQVINYRENGALTSFDSVHVPALQ